MMLFCCGAQSHCAAARRQPDASTCDVDELLASLDPAEWHPDARHEVFADSDPALFERYAAELASCSFFHRLELWTN
jgi:hypothetical protein